MKVLTPRKQQKVVAAYPHPTQVSARFHKSWDALRQYDFSNLKRIADGGGHLANSSGANVTNARNEIVAKFLDHHDADWLWFIDTDMVFDPDLLDRMVEAAHPWERPILGALCFSVQDGFRACPTLYMIREDGKAGRIYDYPANTLMRCFTGTGCLLIHRTVLEKMRERAYDPAYPWFQETRTQDLPIGEDITFCIRAEALGIPVHVDTSIKCGHEKTYVVDESVYQAQKQAGLGETPTPFHAPTYAVIASKNRRAMLTRLIEQLRPQCQKMFVYDNGYDPPFDDGALQAHDWPLHRMWNHGIDRAASNEADEIDVSSYGDDRGRTVRGSVRPHNVLVINDDVEVGPNLVQSLNDALRSGDFDMAIPSTGGMTGWCFMLRGEAGLRLDEQFEWWYGDTDLAKQCSGRIAVAPDAEARHLDPMRSTMEDPVRLEMARRDEARFAEKWGLDPATLWLARHEQVAS